MGKLTPLPVSLRSFSATGINNGIALNWKTASEKNNNYFELLRSGDDKNFVKIAKITGAGKSDKEVNYSFTDTKPATGNNYYLLNQVDFDGAIKSYTDLVQNVNFGLSSNNIYASLTNNKLSLKIISNANAAGNIKLYDLNGKLAVNKKILLSKGINQLEEGLNLPTGVYMLNIDVDGHSKSFKLLKD